MDSSEEQQHYGASGKQSRSLWDFLAMHLGWPYSKAHRDVDDVLGDILNVVKVGWEKWLIEDDCSNVVKEVWTMESNCQFSTKSKEQE
ncbi:hypothetical protein V6N11_044180 [Hibiscus sabdariffa]|uniref:RNase H type-1 domain-containing protein n=1 Tax=Hibiscus sabdariffa TaxID=183260 RepID=A0ABR2REI0_9ROSI